MGRQQRRDGNSTLTGELTPEARAVLEVIFAKYAAPGMCNPDDPEPCTSGTPTQAQIDNDHRSLAQRQHDALIAVGRIALMSGQLGQLNGLPVSIIIRTTLQDLESRAGVGVTGGGTVMPITEVIRLAAHANHYLAVFDKATGSALDLFRAKRVASPAQRIMLIGREGGCTKPCCTVGAYGAQVHHVWPDWVDGGNTNVDELGLACGPDNRMVDRRRLDHHHQRPRRSRMDPTPTPGHRPSPGQLLPPTRTTPTPTRRRTRTRRQADRHDDATANRNRHPVDDDAESRRTHATTDTVNPHRPNRSGTAAAANRNRSTPWQRRRRSARRTRAARRPSGLRVAAVRIPAPPPIGASRSAAAVNLRCAPERRCRSSLGRAGPDPGMRRD